MKIFVVSIFCSVYSL